MDSKRTRAKLMHVLTTTYRPTCVVIIGNVSRVDPGFWHGVSPLHFIPVSSLPYPLLPFSLEVGLLLQPGNLGSNEMVLIVVNN